MYGSAGRSRWIAILGLATLAGCGVEVGGGDELGDATSDGFLDVAPPQGVAFDESTNLSISLVSAIDDADVAAVAAAQNVPNDYIDLLPFVTVTATADLQLQYANGEVTEFSDSARVEPFQRGYEFACPERMNITLRADLIAPLGSSQTLFRDASTVLQRDEDFVCGETLYFVAYVDAQGVAHFEQQFPD